MKKVLAGVFLVAGITLFGSPVASAATKSEPAVAQASQTGDDKTVVVVVGGGGGTVVVVVGGGKTVIVN